MIFIDIIGHPQNAPKPPQYSHGNLSRLLLLSAIRSTPSQGDLWAILLLNDLVKSAYICNSGKKRMAFDAAKFCASIQNASRKISLPDFSSKLRELNLPCSSSWARTVLELTDAANSSVTSVAHQTAMEQLVAWFEDYLRYFSKAIAVYNLGNISKSRVDDIGSSIAGGLSRVKIANTHPAGAFPAVADSVQMKGLSGTKICRSITATRFGIELVFSSFSEYQVREPIVLSQNDQQVLPKISTYYKLIGLKRVVHEHVDIVRVSHGLIEPGVGSVELLLDATRPGTSVLNNDEVLSRVKSYVDLVNALGVVPVTGVSLPDAMNFFSAMDKVYNSKDGNVCELGFSTTIGGSVKREKMKRNTSDLRTETWHAGGRQAIATALTPDTIDIYRLSVSWKIMSSNDQPVLTIPGSYRGSSTGVIRYAFIFGCSEVGAFDHAFYSLLKFSK
ncbi:hypothetical protein [Pseudomonas amygdali]|nr:hypothetical protein [Pseudomonas amygdali]KPB28443.1 Prophage PssSM-02 [Pseudomonas amygdali pv. sesami]